MAKVFDNKMVLLSNMTYNELIKKICGDSLTALTRGFIYVKFYI